MTTQMFSMLIKFHLIGMLITILTGCTTTRLPNTNDFREIDEYKKAIVILRIIWESEGEQIEPFSSKKLNERILIHLGRIETRENIQPIGIYNHFFLSPETRKQGWTYFYHQPGTYFLSAATESAYYQSPPKPIIWRFDIPNGVRAIYIGTLHVECGAIKEIFGVKVKQPATLCDGTILDERESAGKIINELIPSLDPLQYSIIQMQRAR
jgi:hypothetical protein